MTSDVPKFGIIHIIWLKHETSMIKIINTVHIKQNFGPFYEPDPLIIDPGKN